MIEIIIGNLFDSKEKYIVHQCNCITKCSAHLAKDVFNHYPYADIYSGRTSVDSPGDIIIKGNGLDQRYVIAIFGQYYPGSSKFPTSSLDGSRIREKYFHKGLLKIARLENLESVAFPWRVSCGAAGGNWDHYLETLNNFAKYINDSQGAKAYVYRREGDK